ncbi:MAG: hypothetical protein V4683_11505 [Bacteroidota bacterium]
MKQSIKFHYKIPSIRFKLGKVIIKFLLISVMFSLLGLYFQTEIYNFFEPKPFSGRYFYNPYQNWDKNKVVKANFHAHSKSWKGLTNGHNTEDEICNAYKKLGFGVAAVSNYHKIINKSDPQLIEIPTYEHGFNISKAHLLAINADETNFLDFPLFQGTSQKQHKIYQLKQSNAMVALAHPGLRNAYTKDDLRYMKGYTFMEVLSPYFKSFELWDYALSLGNLSWLLANDDTHDLKKQPPGKFFNLISTQSTSKGSLLNSLKNGTHLGYSSKNGIVDVFLDKIAVSNSEIYYSFSGKSPSVKAIIDGKPIKLPAKGKIELKEETKYVRFEVSGAKSTLFTNPVFRAKSATIEAGYGVQSVRISKNKTINYRLKLAGISFLIISSFFYNSISSFLRNLKLLKNSKAKYSIR